MGRALCPCRPLPARGPKVEGYRFALEWLRVRVPPSTPSFLHAIARACRNAAIRNRTGRGIVCSLPGLTGRRITVGVAQRQSGKRASAFSLAIPCLARTRGPKAEGYRTYGLHVRIVPSTITFMGGVMPLPSHVHAHSRAEG